MSTPVTKSPTRAVLGSTPEQSLFGAYVRELFSFVCVDSERRGGSIDHRHEIARLRSQTDMDAPNVGSRSDVSNATTADVAPSIRAEVPAVANMVHDVRRRAAESGLGTIAVAWPDAAIDRLEELLQLTEAVERLWAMPEPAGTEMHRARLALDERIDAAVRYVSATMFAMAREQEISEVVLDRGGVEFAEFLGDRLFRDQTRVFASQRQAIIDAQHQLVGRPGPNPRVRCIAFGIKDSRGAIASKAIVEADIQRGGAP